MNVNEFINDAKNNGEENIYVRGRKLAEEHRVRELRTKKHDHQALFWDELGNAIVLTRRGQVLQLIGNEIPGR